MRSIALSLVLCACGSSAPHGIDDDAGASTMDSQHGGLVTLPPVNAKADYQLGGAYPPPAGVTVVSRDRTESPAAGLYNICYVSGFQIQHTPDEEAYWNNEHPDLILRDGGSPVIDTAWSEMLIDVSTPGKRAIVAEIVGGWIDGCKQAGFNAVEIDNLDSFSRSHALLTETNAVDAMALFSARAHQAGLAIAQKNSAEIVGRRADLGTDFAVSEECNRYSGCDVYQNGYGDHVIVIEYRVADFQSGCSKFPTLSIILRDLNLVTPAAGAYVYDAC